MSANANGFIVSSELPRSASSAADNAGDATPAPTTLTTAPPARAGAVSHTGAEAPAQPPSGEELRASAPQPHSPDESQALALPPPGVHRQVVRHGERRFVILDLPRVDDASLHALRATLQDLRPQALAVELDTQRLEWIGNQESWQALNLIDVLKARKGTLLNAYLALRIFQKRFGSFDGTEPGDEFRVAMEEAERSEAPLHLVDRDMTITGLRAWRRSPVWMRLLLILTMTFGSFRRTKARPASEHRDRVQRRLKRLERSLPAAKAAFVDERDAHLACSIEAIDAPEVVAVLSTVHADRVATLLQAGPRPEACSDAVPPKSLFSRIFPWVISAAIIATFTLGFALGDPSTIRQALLTWFLVNGVCTAIATSAALAHPLTILASSLSAPIVSLNPAVGAGMVGGLVQLLIAPPSIKELEQVGDDIARLKGWWQNRLAKIALVFILANLGSTIGTVVALLMFPDLFGS
ncbi:TraB family protein [Lujinxingia sediminis]|uniref:TraB family protein n=1 Tax=Lujinxingia sediminis TaxID=2480984 RepID=A0ABY0CUP6_9DELT|nr:TraB family protein [Lujinxingia sediminis]